MSITEDERLEWNAMSHFEKVHTVANEVQLGMNCQVIIGQDRIQIDAQTSAPGRYYYQIECWRKDVITGHMGYGRGGKAYLSEHMTRNELVQCIFGLYQSYWIHEARENFQWRGRRVFGPHIDTEALWDAATHIDARSQKHVEDKA